MAIHQILFVITILMALFCAVNTVKCYAEGSMKNQPLTEEECIGDEKGCMLGLECLDKKKETFTGVIRSCQPDPDFCNEEVSTNVKWNAVCKECSYCTGDLCNDKGLKKTGLKCYTNGRDGADNGSVAECLTGQVGCLSALKCGPYTETLRGCIWTKDACTIDMLGAIGGIYKDICESCNFCDTELCNNQGIEMNSTPKEKSTTKTVEKPETTKKPESDEKATPKTVVKTKSNSVEKPKYKEVGPPRKTDADEVAEPDGGEEGATDPPNGAAGFAGWGQIGIIPIGMIVMTMTLMLAACCIKMSII